MQPRNGQLRVSPEFLDAMVGSDLWTGLTEMAERGHIKPLATRGIISQVSQDIITYDAETAVGGSGGPVLDLGGSVVAINRAVVGQLGGSSPGCAGERGYCVPGCSAAGAARREFRQAGLPSKSSTSPDDRAFISWRSSARNSRVS